MKDKRVDAYISKAEPFAKPVLMHLRKLVHAGCPDIEETIKWGFPAFDYKGVMCSMASFKQHCVFGFWKSSMLKDPKGYLQEQSNKGGEAMGNLGRITGLKDLPPDKAILDFIKQAVKLNEQGIKMPARKTKPKTELVEPDYFMNALKKNKKALVQYEQFSYSHKKEYLGWITEAKTEETRTRRMETAMEWIAEGKGRNWKYEKKK